MHLYHCASISLKHTRTCSNMCIFVHVHAQHIHICTHLHTHTHIHTYTRRYTCTYACTYTRTHTRTYTRTHKPSPTQKHAHAHTHTNTHKHARALAHTHTHTTMHREWCRKKNIGKQTRKQGRARTCSAGLDTQ